VWIHNLLGFSQTLARRPPEMHHYLLPADSLDPACHWNYLMPGVAAFYFAIFRMVGGCCVEEGLRMNKDGQYSLAMIPIVCAIYSRSGRRNLYFAFFAWIGFHISNIWLCAAVVPGWLVLVAARGRIVVVARGRRAAASTPARALRLACSSCCDDGSCLTSSTLLCTQGGRYYC
jgi:hypothetical protein